MSKQEIYAWTSLAATTALLGYYVLVVWGLPQGLEVYRDQLQTIFLRVIGIAIVVELLLELGKRSLRGGVVRDERDEAIVGRAYRNAFYFLIVAVVAVLANVFVSEAIAESTGARRFMARPYATFHALLLAVFAANITKSITQLYYYRKGITHGRA